MGLYPLSGKYAYATENNFIQIIFSDTMKKTTKKISRKSTQLIKLRSNQKTEKLKLKNRQVQYNDPFNGPLFDKKAYFLDTQV